MPAVCRSSRANTTTKATPTTRKGTMKSVISQSGVPARKLCTAITTKTDTAPFQATQATKRPNSVQPGECVSGRR